MTIPASSFPEHPILSLLAEVPRLRDSLLWGWTEGWLLPALDYFHENASEAELATAMVKLRQVLLERAKFEAWLRPIALHCSAEFLGELRAMTPASNLPQSIELPDNRTKNQFTADLARRLRESLLTSSEKKSLSSSTSTPRSRNS